MQATFQFGKYADVVSGRALLRTLILQPDVG